jgi:polyphosphate kinase
LGQFLEHSRIYMFGQNKNSKIYIGSADMMQRNLRHRIEILVPILDAKIKDYLIKLLKMYLKSDSNTWEMDNKGNWNNLNGKYSIQEKLKN